MPQRLYRTPIGELRQLSSGDLTIALNYPVHTLPLLEAKLQKLAMQQLQAMLLPTLEQPSGVRDSMHLHFRSQGRSLKPVSHYVRVWRQSPDLGLGSVIALVNKLRGWQKIQLPFKNDLPFSPLTVLIDEKEPEQFFYLFIPTAESEVDVGRWAQADPLLWQWLDSSMITLQGKVDNDYVLAACLYYCLVDDLLPNQLSKPEQFDRWLRSRVGSSDAIFRAYARALPRTYSDEARQLATAVWEKLNPQYEGQKQGNQESDYWLSAFTNLTDARLALRWEREGHLDKAQDLLLQSANYGHSQEKSWLRLVRLKERMSDWEGGFQFLLNALKAKEDRADMESLYFIWRWANEDVAPEIIHNAIKEIENHLPKERSPQHALKLAHLELEYLKAPEKALRRIQPGDYDTWHQLMQEIIQARATCILRDYPATSRHCAAGLKILDKMRLAETKQAYLSSYFSLIDGIAHFGASQTLKDPFYLRKSLPHFCQALNYAFEAHSDYLIEVSLQWLKWLDSFANFFPENIGQLFLVGISAFLEAKQQAGYHLPIVSDVMPSTPIYPEEFLFTVYNSSLE